MAQTERRKRAANGDPVLHGTCVVCGERDARLLVMVELRGGAAATLCGSHALLHARTGERATNVTELRAALRDRRSSDRRARGEGDELAEQLTRAFSRERRGTERRAG
jgi:hypothetical protein